MAEVAPEIVEHYEEGLEAARLQDGHGRLELLRTQEILRRHLPDPPATILDVGGGPGAHARWLAADGHRVHVVDPVPLHVEQAAAVPGVTAELGDARALATPDVSRDAVLLLGPLYHLHERDDRVRALEEARRVVRPGGLVAAAAISRFSSLLDGLRLGRLVEPSFRAMVDRDLVDGRHSSPPGSTGTFTTAFFHHPDELATEIRAAGLDLLGVLGVEGPCWLLGDLGPRWDDPDQTDALLAAARTVEAEPTVVGVSAHLLALARRPA